jgi:NADH-quinone oxidoreductase subunit M
VLACWGGLIIGAVYLLRAIRAMLHGAVPEKWAEVTDAATAWRKAPFAILIAALLVFGFFPRLLTDRIQPSASRLLEAFRPTAARAQAGVPLRPGVQNSEWTRN